MSSKVTLVGAGLVGSLLSIFLAKKGHQVEVFERRPDYRKIGAVGGRSINLALSERGWRALKQAGIEQKIKDIALPMRGRMMHGTDGELTFQPYGKENQAIYSVSRAILNEALMDVAEKKHNVKFNFNQSCEDVDVRETKATFEDTEKNNQRNVVKSDIIIGADGAFSAVRGHMQRTPLFNYRQNYLPHGYKELHIPANEDGTHKLAPDALHIWPRHSFMLIALPNTDGSFTCTLFLRFEADKGNKEAFDRLNTDEEIMEFFETYFSDTIPVMPTLLEDFKQNPTSSLVTIRCSPWAYEGNVCLIGDASHAIVPFYGQGMNSGFEDCFYFDEFMEKYSSDGKIDWKEMFEAFQEERIPNANAIADLAIQNFIEMRDRVADPEFLLRKKIEAKLYEKFPSRWIPQYTMVTFSHLPYSYALDTGKKQEQIMNEIMKKEDIETNWENLDWEEIVEKLHKEVELNS